MIPDYERKDPMETRKLMLTLSEEIIRDFGIMDDTLFITSYANGKLTVEVIDDSDDEDEAR